MKDLTNRELTSLYEEVKEVQRHPAPATVKPSPALGKLLKQTKEGCDYLTREREVLRLLEETITKRFVQEHSDQWFNEDVEKLKYYVHTRKRTVIAQLKALEKAKDKESVGNIIDFKEEYENLSGYPVEDFYKDFM